MRKSEITTVAGTSRESVAAKHGACERPPWPRTIAVVGLMAGCFSFLEMGLLPILPVIQRSLAGAGTTSTALLESGVLIVAAVSAPLLGRLGDVRGKKNMLLATLGLYFIGALGAGFAPDFIALILFRALQGVGGALLLLSIAFARDEVPDDKLSIGIGWIIGAFGAGACLGVSVSGLIAESLSWRYLFFCQCLLLVLGAAVVVAFLPRSPERRDERVDYPGVALLGAALASLIMGLTEVLRLHWIALGLFVLAGLLFIAWIFYERRVDHPLLDVKILAHPRVLLPNLGSGLAGYGAFSALFLVPRFAQVPRHLPAQVADQLHYGFNAATADIGLFLLPLGAGLLCAGPFGGVIGRRYGGKGPFVSGLALVAIACALLAFVHANEFEFAVWVFLLGAGFGMSTGAGNVFVAEAVDKRQTAIAIAFNTLMRLIAGGIGAQIAAMLLLSQSVGGGHASRESAFTLAFGVSALLGLVGVVIALLVPTDRPP
ncbi:MAG: MFS transporter [Gammaproteobacteria bacterium]